MKKTALFLFSMLFALVAFSQPPQAFNYQGLARNTNGTPLATRKIALRVSILAGSVTGKASYVETHDTQTDAQGLFNILIGRGTSVLNKLDSVKWATADHFLQLEMDPQGGKNFQLLGVTQLLSVPYALYSGNGSQWKNNSGGINYDGNLSVNGDVIFKNFYQGLVLKSQDGSCWHFGVDNIGRVEMIKIPCPK
jgi:trimeric autotransporter adhesin